MNVGMMILVVEVLRIMLVMKINQMRVVILMMIVVMMMVVIVEVMMLILLM